MMRGGQQVKPSNETMFVHTEPSASAIVTSMTQDGTHLGQQRPLSALPSPLARAIAFTGIALGGLAGALIGYALIAIQCAGSCALEKGLGIFFGAVISAAGMSVVAVLALRAMGEWREITDREAAGHPGF
jgi:multisubunit Na+/H+ antiporter MnhG subunit